MSNRKGKGILFRSPNSPNIFLIKRESKQERSEGLVFASSGIPYLVSHHTGNISF